MTNLTIRVDENLKNKAAKEAEKLGISLTFVVTNALRNFVESPKIIIGEAETLVVTPEIQGKMDIIGMVLEQLKK